MLSQLLRKNAFFLKTVIAIFLPVSSSFAWGGFDFDSKTSIEIEEGNLVREGLVIQFYDYQLDRYHAGKILFIDSVADGTRIQLKDLDANQERTFIMQSD
jgi:hypothetical protein